MPLPKEVLVVENTVKREWYLIDAEGCKCCLHPISDIYPTLSALCASEPRAVGAFMSGDLDVQ